VLPRRRRRGKRQRWYWPLFAASLVALVAAVLALAVVFMVFLS
jgi:hypothetical protein